MEGSYYYKLEEAELFKQRFTSWVGKRSHIGNGISQTLKAIEITPKAKLKHPSKTPKLFKIEFCFEGEIKLDAHEFLFYNALKSYSNVSDETRNRSESAAQ
jgi:hypothetical protein